MRTVTHREMRNQSGEILRAVAAGETVRVTNHGHVAALIVAPNPDPIADLVAAGQARPARRPLKSLREIDRRAVAERSSEILEDARGHW